MKRAWSVLAVSLSVVSYSAVAKLGESNGFSGEIALNAAYASKTSNLSNTDDEFRTYTGEAQENSSALVLPLGNVQYTWGSRSNHQVFLGTSRADVAVGTLALETGYRYQFQDGTKWSLAILPTILEGEVWRDPYLENQARSTTNEKGTAYRMQIDNIAGSLFSLDLAYGKRELDSEQSGSGAGLSAEQRATLDRNADILYGKFKMMLPISKGVLLFPALIYTQQDANGSAMKSNTYGAEISSFVSAGNHQFAFTVTYLNRKYDGANPIPEFDGATRKDDEWKAFLAYEYPGIFYADNLSLVAFGGVNNSSSNIAFYDEKDWITSVGLNWEF